MDDFVRRIVDERIKWGPPDRDQAYDPPDLSTDYAARVIACLLDRMGDPVMLSAQEIQDVPTRLMVLPWSTDDGLSLEVRRLAK